MNFFANLNFSSSNEDSATELQAIGHGRERILALTASGARPLDLLLSNPKHIIALDLNPVQNYLLALKIAAFLSLNYEQMLQFLGIHSDKNRWGKYELIRESLDIPAREYWDQHAVTINRGVLFEGLWERFFKKASWLHLTLRRKNIDALFHAQSLSAQKQIWEDHFDNFGLKFTIYALGSNWIWTNIMGEAGGEFIPSRAEIYHMLKTRMSSAASQFYFRESDFLNLVFYGRYQFAGSLPLHLRAENFEFIRSRLSCISIITGGLDQLSTLEIANCDAFSLSDFSSYCDKTAYQQIWNAVIKSATNGATFCERVFLNELPIDSNNVQINSALSDHLSKVDKAIIYKIRAGQIWGHSL